MPRHEQGSSCDGRHDEIATSQMVKLARSGSLQSQSQIQEIVGVAASLISVPFAVGLNGFLCQYLIPRRIVHVGIQAPPHSQGER